MKSFLLILLTISLQAFAQAPAPMHILILGDSLTEGYGLSKENAYPYLLEQKLNEKYAPKKFQVTNAGISGSTSASGPSRLRWHLKNPTDLVLLVLGANDGLRGQSVEKMKDNLLAMIKILKEKKIKVILVGMKLPLNYGKEYTSAFEKVFPDLAKQEKIPLIPFLLEGVAGKQDLNLPDHVHPNEKGHKIVADYMLKELEPYL
jgi:acyl-CoA thioesterase-1